MVHDVKTKTSTYIECLKDPVKRAKPTKGKSKEAPAAPAIDFSKKVTHTAWHPTLDVVAVAGLSKLYFYEAKHGQAKVQGGATGPVHGAMHTGEVRDKSKAGVRKMWPSSAVG